MSMLLNVCMHVASVCAALISVICVWKALWDWCCLDMAFSYLVETIKERRKARKEMRFIRNQVKTIGYEMVEDKAYPINRSGTFWCYEYMEKPTLKHGTLKGVRRNSWVCENFPTFEILEEGYVYGTKPAFGVKWDDAK